MVKTIYELCKPWSSSVQIPVIGLHSNDKCLPFASSKKSDTRANGKSDCFIKARAQNSLCVLSVIPQLVFTSYVLSPASCPFVLLQWEKDRRHRISLHRSKNLFNDCSPPVMERTTHFSKSVPLTKCKNVSGQ